LEGVARHENNLLRKKPQETQKKRKIHLMRKKPQETQKNRFSTGKKVEQPGLINPSLNNMCCCLALNQSIKVRK
jgi:hypothetical protein